MKKKVMIAVGGTGGHIYPSVALAKELHKTNPGISVMFVGGDLKKNRFFQAQDFLHASVACAPVNSKNPFKLLKNLKNILKGMWQSRKAIKQFNPDIIVGFGSYHTFPTLMAAKLSKIPIILHEANSIPGKVNKLLSKHAVATGIHFPDAANHLKGNIVEVGMPLREGYKMGSVRKQTAKNYFFLKENKLTILIFGGSQGAKKINDMVSVALSLYYEGKKDALQVLHFTGDSESVKSIEELYAKNEITACVKDFENRMDLAWAATDIVISRAGAATIAEQLEFEVPGILIPYPYAADAHQDKNASFMTKTVGGAISFMEKDLDAEKLGKKISIFLNHDQILLRTMQDAMREYKKNARPKDLCSLILNHL